MLHYCIWWFLILSFHLILGLPLIFSNPNFCLNFPSRFSYVIHLIFHDFIVQKMSEDIFRSYSFFIKWNEEGFRISNKFFKPKNMEVQVELKSLVCCIADFFFVLSINVILLYFIYLGIHTVTAYFVWGVFVRTVSASLITNTHNTSCVEIPIVSLLKTCCI